MLEATAIGIMLCALLPAVLFCVNLRLYQPPPVIDSAKHALPAISVLIPARNEERSIGAAVASVLGSTGVALEVIVMDDSSIDGTGEVVANLANADFRVRLAQAPPLPAGWNGKQHACWSLASLARCGLMCFMDADVRLEPHALARMAAFLKQADAALVSGFPREETGTWLEWLLLPLIHFVLLGFLPIARMRSNTDPSLAAGCGQFLLVKREAYLASGGHAEIRSTMHDGLLLPRLFRQHGYRTDLADLTNLAACRMYRNAREVWLGLAKNATEGIADPRRIVPFSLFLIVSQVLQFVLAAWFAIHGKASRLAWAFLLIAMAAAWLPRVLAMLRFRQDVRGCILHPVSIVVLLIVQWYSLSRKLLGGAVSWKDRAYLGE